MYDVMMIAMNDVYIHVNRMNTEQYINDSIVLLIHNDAIDVLQNVKKRNKQNRMN